MGMQQVTQTVAWCDRPECPDAQIDTSEPFIDAGVYGCAFHRMCWDVMTGPELAKVLGLDDIRWFVDGERGGKVIYNKDPS